MKRHEIHIQYESGISNARIEPTYSPKESEDIVNKITSTARRNQLAVWAIIIGIVLATVLTLVNQTIEFLKNIGAFPSCD